MENTELLPLGTEQGREETEYSSFDLCLGESFVSPLVEQHRQWLKSIRHETPSPMKKRNSRLLACALAVVLCMTAFSIPTFAAGYYASNENGNNTPPDAIESITVSTENVNLPANSSASGIPALTPDGNLTSIDDILQSAASVSTEDSLENKQFKQRPRRLFLSLQAEYHAARRDE